VNKQGSHKFHMERFNLGRSVGIVRSRTKGHGVCLFEVQSQEDK
jgi:hypothetical protein